MKKIFQNLFLSFLLVILCQKNFAKAQNINDQAVIQQDWITRNQQNKIEEDRRLKEEDAIKKDLELKQKEQNQNNLQNLGVVSQNADCFTIKSINLIDAQNFSKKAQQKILANFIGKCVEAKTLNEIILAIQNYYSANGYATARVLLPKQNIQNGNLNLQIIIGKIDEIIVGNNNLSNKMQELTAFGFIEGKPLNLQDINQGIYQINRLASNNATMKIEPSTNDGAAKVYVANDKKFPARATISRDNLGNNFTGIKRTNFSGSLDNMLQLNDSLNLNYSTNLNDDSAKKEIRSFSSNFSLPFAYNTFSYDYSRSEFKGQNKGVNGILTLTGFSQRNAVTIDRVLLSKGNFRLATSASLATKSSASYLNNSKLETSERKLTIGNFAFTISNYFENGVNLYLKPSYSRGLKILNAKKDDENLSAATPKAQFDYFKFYASISKKAFIPALQIPFSMSSELDSQFAKQTLFGSEQFAVGGYYSVRGFRENYISADSGYYLRNKLNFNLGALVRPFSRAQSENLVAPNFGFLNQFSFEPFYDYGYARNKYANNKASGRLSGAGLKTIFSSKYFNASLTYSWGINQSQLTNLNNSGIKENKLIYFELSTNCC